MAACEAIARNGEHDPGSMVYRHSMTPALVVLLLAAAPADARAGETPVTPQSQTTLGTPAGTTTTPDASPPPAPPPPETSPGGNASEPAPLPEATAPQGPAKPPAPRQQLKIL